MLALCTLACDRRHHGLHGPRGPRRSFKNRPSLGAELLTEALGVALPSYTEARLVSIDLTKIRPAEYRADVVVLLLDADVPIGVLIIEVQLGIDPQKRYAPRTVACLMASALRPEPDGRIRRRSAPR